MKSGVFWDVTQRGSCKNRVLQGPQCATSQKTPLFNITTSLHNSDYNIGHFIFTEINTYKIKVYLSL
jgi:hypothetical protein